MPFRFTGKGKGMNKTAENLLHFQCYDICLMICMMILDGHIRVASFKYINMMPLFQRNTSRDVDRCSKMYQTLDSLEGERNLEENGCSLTFSFCTYVLQEIRP